MYTTKYVSSQMFFNPALIEKAYNQSFKHTMRSSIASDEPKQSTEGCKQRAVFEVANCGCLEGQDAAEVAVRVHRCPQWA